MAVLQEQKLAIYRDVMYSGFAGVKIGDGMRRRPALLPRAHRHCLLQKGQTTLLRKRFGAPA